MRSAKVRGGGRGEIVTSAGRGNQRFTSGKLMYHREEGGRREERGEAVENRERTG